VNRIHKEEARIQTQAREEIRKEKEASRTMLMKVVKLSALAKSQAVKKLRHKEGALQAHLKTEATKAAARKRKAAKAMKALKVEHKRNRTNKKVIRLLKHKAKNVGLFAMAVQEKLKAHGEANPAVERVVKELKSDSNNIDQLLHREADREEEDVLEREIYGLRRKSKPMQVGEKIIKQMDLKAGLRRKHDKSVITQARLEEASLKAKQTSGHKLLKKINAKIKDPHTTATELIRLKRQAKAAHEEENKARALIGQLEVKQVVANKDVLQQKEEQAHAHQLLQQSKPSQKPTSEAKHTHKRSKTGHKASKAQQPHASPSLPVIPTLTP